VNINLPTPEDELMMEAAIAIAWKAIASGSSGVGALLHWRNEILALDHNQAGETGDLTAHAEMVVIRQAAKRLNQMSAAEKAEVTLYTTLEPCLMCLSAISLVGIKRVVYAALVEDAVATDRLAQDINIEKMNPLLTRGSLELIPGVQREAGKALLAQMGKQA